jgi:hypothetical protein
MTWPLSPAVSPSTILNLLPPGSPCALASSSASFMAFWIGTPPKA